MTAFPGPAAPVMEALGGELVSWDEAAGTVVLRYPIRDGFKNPFGVLQGGIATAMADNAVGICAWLGDRTRRSTTIELSSRFLRPLARGHATVRGAILKRGRSTVVLEVDVLDDDGKLCVRTTATNLYLDAAP